MVLLSTHWLAASDKWTVNLLHPGKKGQRMKADGRREEEGGMEGGKKRERERGRERIQRKREIQRVRMNGEFDRHLVTRLGVT